MHWCIIVSCLLLWVTGGLSSGVIEVKLLAYWSKEGKDEHGYCCNNSTVTVHCSPCNPYLEIFLGNFNNTRVNVSNIVTTMTYTASNNVTFNNNIGHSQNPFKLTFEDFSNSIVLFTRVINDNAGGMPNALELLQYRVGQGEPSSFNHTPAFTKKEVYGTTSVLEFDYRIQCDVYYYGSCDVYCRPIVGQYSCNRKGQKICQHGWSGLECNISSSTIVTGTTTPASTLVADTTPASTLVMHTYYLKSSTSTLRNMHSVSNSTSMTQANGQTIPTLKSPINMTAVVCGSVIGSLLLLAAIVVIFIFLLKKNKRLVRDDTFVNNET